MAFNVTIVRGLHNPFSIIPYLLNTKVKCKLTLSLRQLFIKLIFEIMKNVHIFSLTLVMLLFSLASCGESEEEKQARLQAYQDSLRAVEQAKVAEMMAQMQDSIEAAEAEEMPVEEETTSSSPSLVEDGAFVVQVGAWRSEDKAQMFVNQWADRNYPNAYVVKIGDEATGDIWFRVRVGDFNAKADAESFGAELSSEINSGYWVATKN